MRRMESYGRETVSSTAIIKIAQDARIAKCWVFVGDKWYTPGELETNYKDFLKYYFEDFKIKDPRPVIMKGRKRIEEIQRLQLEFEKKVNDFYNGRIK